jgi:hypothetical protein
MAKIYTNAKLCLIWIGDEDELSGPTMVFLQILGRFAKTFRTSDRSADTDLQLRSDLQDINQARGWDNLDSFFSRPWFSRRWVAQELCFAKSAVICCGTAIMDWEELDHSLLLMRHQFYKLERDLGQAWLTAQELIEYRRTGQNEFGTGSERLTEPLRWFSRFECKDDKDRVFALLSLINEGQRVSYQPDYTKTVEEVYISFAEHCISHDDSLRILNLASSPLDHSPCDSRLPSWVPDWRRTFLTGSHLIGVFTAGEGLQGETTTKPVVENLHLLIQGICFDEIRSSSVELEPSVTNASLKDHETHLRIWEAMFKPLGQESRETKWTYINGEHPWSAFSRTLVADNALTNTHMALKVPQNSPQAILARYLACQNPDNTRPFTDDQIPLALSRDIPTTEHPSGALNYLIASCTIMEGRSFFISQSGYIGFGPRNTKNGDIIAVLERAQTPFVLRKDGESE